AAVVGFRVTVPRGFFLDGFSVAASIPTVSLFNAIVILLLVVGGRPVAAKLEARRVANPVSAPIGGMCTYTTRRKLGASQRTPYLVTLRRVLPALPTRPILVSGEAPSLLR